MAQFNREFKSSIVKFQCLQTNRSFQLGHFTPRLSGNRWKLWAVHQASTMVWVLAIMFYAMWEQTLYWFLGGFQLSTFYTGHREWGQDTIQPTACQAFQIQSKTTPPCCATWSWHPITRRGRPKKNAFHFWPLFWKFCNLAGYNEILRISTVNKT